MKQSSDGKKWKVIVAIQTYNLEKYISQCLDSVLIQKTEFPFKIMVWDDASTDQTPQVLSDYQKRYPTKIELHFSERNAGNLLCSNQLFARVGDCEYFSLLDGDDLWVGENRLQHQVDFLDNHPAYMLCAGQVHHLIDGKIGKGLIPDAFLGKTYNFEDFFRTPWLFHTSSLLVRNVIFCNGLPNYFYTMANTWEECVLRGEEVRRMLHLEKGPLYVLSEVVSYYRIHSKGEWTGMSEAGKAIESAITTHWYRKYYRNRYMQLHPYMKQYDEKTYKDMWAVLINKGYVYPTFRLDKRETTMLSNFLQDLEHGESVEKVLEEASQDEHLLNNYNLLKEQEGKLSRSVAEINASIKRHMDEVAGLRRENRRLIDEKLDLKLQFKKVSYEKINIVFVCHRPAVWGSLATVYEAFQKDEAFSVQIVAIPNKKQLPGSGFGHEVYESEGAESFWKAYGCLQGYDYKTGKWLDLRTLNPDYIFFQQPYNVQRCATYKSWEIAKFAKICYVAYACDFLEKAVLDETTPADFMNDVSFCFTQNPQDHQANLQRLEEIGNRHTRVCLTGFPRYDNVGKQKTMRSPIWDREEEHSFRILWTPRWTTNEGNCGFFDYKDRFFSYCDEHDDVDFVFRPHPQAFLEWNATGEMSKEAEDEFRHQYDVRHNMRLDENGEYFSTFYASDCLITDVSSIIADYFLTEKPIIYCHKKECFNDFSRKLSEGFYWAYSWEDVVNILEKLKKGEDSLREKRKHLIQECYYLPRQGAGHEIKEFVKKDALK